MTREQIAYEQAKRENAELRDELVATQEFGAKMAHDRESAIYDLDDAEARIKAVEDVLYDGTWTGLSSGKDWVSATAIRRALEG